VAGKGPEIIAEQGIVMGDVPLLPIQHWFFEQSIPNRHHWNQALMLSINSHLDSDLLRKAVGGLVNQHDALRLRFRMLDSKWQQFHAEPDDNIPYEYQDLTQVPEEELEETIARLATELQTSLDLANGPVLRTAYIFLWRSSTWQVNNCCPSPGD